MDYVPCKPMEAPDPVLAAEVAVQVNPANAPPMFALGDEAMPYRLAAMTTKYWSPSGKKFAVGFMAPIAANLRDKILAHANAWSEFANVSFVWTQDTPSADVRIAFERDDYWSYLGTDILSIPRNRPTMNLQGFDRPMPESEYFRVVRHEFGHTLSFPHEHQRKEIIERLDPEKTIAWGARALGWDAQTVRQQILTPLPEGLLIATAHADQTSIMAYDLPATITRDGQPVLGGRDINAQDKAHVAKLYPKSVTPTKPEKPDLCKLLLEAIKTARNFQRGVTMQPQFSLADFLSYFGDVMAIMNAPTTPAKLDAALVLCGKLARLTPNEIDDAVVAFVSTNQGVKDLIVAVIDQYLANPQSREALLTDLHDEVKVQALNPIAIITLVKLILDLIERFRK